MGAPQLNIKDVETTRMVRELAKLTGETSDGGRAQGGRRKAESRKVCTQQT